MERLTEYVTENCSKPFYRFRSDGEIDIRYRYCINIEKAIDKLAEYENTGLEPKEVEQLKHELEVYKKALELLSIKKSEFAREYYIGKEDYDTYMKNDPIRTIKMYLDQAEKELKGEK